MLSLDLALCDAAVELAAMAGVALSDRQQQELKAMCELGPDERWRHKEYRLGYTQPEHGPVLTARALAGLFLFDERRIVWATDDEVDTRRAFQDFAALLDAYEPMRSMVRRMSAANGLQRIELTTGQRIQFDVFSGRRRTRRFRGLSADTIMLDGVGPIDSDERHDLMCSMATARRPQLVHALVVRGEQ